MQMIQPKMVEKPPSVKQLHVVNIVAVLLGKHGTK